MLNNPNELIPLELPIKTTVLSCGVQSRVNIVIWYQFPDGCQKDKVTRYFYVAETGKPMSYQFRQFIGTIQIETGNIINPEYVAHVFEVHK